MSISPKVNHQQSHVLALDGVYARAAQAGELVFHALAAPTADEVTDVASRTAERVRKILARHGRTIDGTGESDVAEPLGEQLALAALCGAAAGHGRAGDGAGEPLLRVVDPARARKSERVGESGGINVHAEVAVPPRDRAFARAPLPLRLPPAHRARTPRRNGKWQAPILPEEGLA